MKGIVANLIADRPLGGFIWTLVRTDFKARYHGSLAGFAWALLKPVFIFLTLLLVFRYLFVQDREYTLNLLVGLLLWDFFAESTKVGLLAIHTKGFLISKAKFPPWIVVVTASSNAIITLFVSCTLVGVIATLFRGPPPLWAIGLFGLYVVQYAIIVTGLSLSLSVLFLRYRDLNQVWDLILQAGFFAAPIVYPLKILPEQFHRYLYLFPVTPIVQFSRSVLVEGRAPSMTGHLMLLVVTVVIFLVGITIFKRLIRSAIEQT